MQKTRTILYSFGIGTITAVAIVLFSYGALAQPREQPTDALQISLASVSFQTATLTKATESDIQFNAIGIVWPDQPSDVWHIRVRGNDNGWSEWYAIEKMGDRLPQGILTRTAGELLFVEPSNAYQLDIPSADRHFIKDTELTLIDSATRTPRSTALIESLFGPLINVFASSNTTIVSREEWGADEDYRFWEPEYARPVKFILHHTAGSDGGDDPSATIRAIYYYHAQTLEWGDIGYNYLIDPQGTIYEGRYGGDGAIGAHTFNDATNTDYNRGTIGISLLGNFERSKPVTAAQDTLISLIAEKAALYDIEPDGESEFNDENLPNVIGHKDVDATLCPGKNLYKRLGSIRTASATERETVAETVKSAALKVETPILIDVDPYTDREVTIKYENTSTATWHESNGFAPQLHIIGTSSPLASESWESDTVVTAMDQDAVRTGEEAFFTFIINAPSSTELITQKFRLVWDGDIVTNSSFQLEVNVNMADWEASLNEHNIPDAMFINDTSQVTLTYVNTGLETWESDDIMLTIEDLNNEPSPFIHEDWESDDGAFQQAESSVTTEGSASFTFTLQAPSAPGRYKQFLQLERADGTAISGSLFDFDIQIDSHFQGSFHERDIPLASLTHWAPTGTIRIKNTGVATWDRNVTLRIYDLGFAPSGFHHSSWPSAYGDIRFNETTVEPGAMATFTFTLDTPDKRGLYLNVFRLEYTGKDIPIQNGAFSHLTRVD